MLKLLCHIHSYPPNHCSGADIYAERINTFLSGKGCEVKVIIDNCDKAYTYKNYTVDSNKRLIAENYEWADIIITHLVTRNQACWLAERFKKPIFHVCHNPNISTLEPNKPDNYIIYNSYWLQKERPLSFPSIVVQPPTFPEDWKDDRTHAEYITLVNLTANKGGDMFYQLALNLPQFKFMGVLGGYGTQMRRPIRNINYEPFTDNMQHIYDMTKILVVPSKTESWSLCAAEAQANGIPVVCSDLPGLRENLGESGIYAANLRGFMDSCSLLMNDPEQYKKHSDIALEHACSKNHTAQLENLYNFMLKSLGMEGESAKSDFSFLVENSYNVMLGNLGKEGEPEIEKKEIETVKEKKEIVPGKEKKIIKRPGTKKQRERRNNSIIINQSCAYRLFATAQKEEINNVSFLNSMKNTFKETVKRFTGVKPLRTEVFITDQDRDNFVRNTLTIYLDLKLIKKPRFINAY